MHLIIKKVCQLMSSVYPALVVCVITSCFDDWQEVSQHVSGGKEVCLESHLCLDSKGSRVCH